MIQQRQKSAVILLVVAYLAFGFTTPSRAATTPADTPKEQLRLTIDRVFSIFENPSLGEVEKKRILREIILPRFDYDEMAKRVLATHWKANKDRMAEFIPLFIGLLEKAYMTMNTFEAAKGAKIEYGLERVDGNIAEVHTKIITKNGNAVPIVYRLRLSGNDWKVYDMAVEGISMVSNYRSQFNKIILTSSFDELLKRMREKVELPQDRR